MKQILSIMVLALLLTGVMPMLASENAEGLTTSYNATADSGNTRSSHATNYTLAYNGASILTDTVENRIGRLTFPPNSCYRSFLSFDTSGISELLTIASVRLYMRTFWGPGNAPTSYWDVNIQNLEYGALDITDYNLNGTSEGSLMNTASFSVSTWYDMFLDIENINRTGKTQYKLTSSIEDITPTVNDEILFYGNGAVSEPYLVIITESPTGAEITYNFTQAGMTNHTVTNYPVEIISWNNTHEQMRYEVYSHNETWLNLSVDSNYTYQSISPFATVVDYGDGHHNITNTYDAVYYNIWFIRAKANVESTIHIALYHATLGEGFFWEKWKVTINAGASYDNNTASRVWNPDYKVSYGGNYTITILDFFNNLITSYSFVANNLEIDAPIPIPVFEFNINNIMASDYVDYRIWFNATGNPYDGHVSPGQDDEIAIRAGIYMFAFTRISQSTDHSNTNISVEWLNLTIDGVHTIIVGDSIIETIKTTVDGTELIVDTISDWTMPSVLLNCYELPVAPVGGTRSAASPSGDARVIRIHPYHMIEATSNYNVSSSTSGDFYDPTPSTGSTTIISDTIDIDGHWETNIMLNTSAGVNFLNITHPQTVDLTQYTNSINCTLWANQSVNAYRSTTWRTTTVFFWNYEPSGANPNRYYTTLQLNNTGPYTWNNILWSIATVNNTIMDKTDRIPSIFDVNNSVYLENGQHFLTSDQAFHMSWDSLNASVWRAFAFTYYTVNDTFNPTEIISISDYVLDSETLTDTYYKGTAHYSNNNENDFTGQLLIKLENLEGVVDPNSIIIYDDSQDYQLGGNVFAYSGNSIIITPDGINGGVASGDTRSYTVYFQYSSADGEVSGLWDTWFSIGNVNMNWHAVILIISVIIGAYAFFIEGNKDTQRRLYELCGIAFMVWGVLYILHAQGVLI